MAAVPASVAVARLLNKHDADRSSIFITHFDTSPVSNKVLGFVGSMIADALMVAITLWFIFLSWSTFYNVLYMVSNNFILLPTPHPMSWWGLTKALVTCWWCRRNYKTYWFHFLYQVIPRLRFGFCSKEIIIRRPRTDLHPIVWRQNFAESLHRATEPMFLQSRLGMGTEVDFWVLDLVAMAEATERTQSGEIEEGTWETTVWWRNLQGRWEGIELWRRHARGDHPRQFPMLEAMLAENDRNFR